MTITQGHNNGNDSQSQPPAEPAPANLLRYGDEDGRDPATAHVTAMIQMQRRINQLRWDDYARQLGVTR